MRVRSVRRYLERICCIFHYFNLLNREFEEADEYCPHCDNHFIIDAETPETKAIKEGKGQLVIGVDGGDMSEDMREKMLEKMLAEEDDIDLTD